jgi:PAT family beta-lactamase induction signal transducer AmpG
VATLYFAEGLPFGLVLDTLPLYLRLHGVSLAAIGFASLLRLPWTLKVLWAPLVDRLGARRWWISGALAVVAITLALLPLVPPAPAGVALLGLLLVFTTAAATQDVAIDAYTIELLAPGEEGVANGVRVSAYRAALIVAGGVLVGFAARAGWGAAWGAAAAVAACLALAVLWLPAVARRPQTTVEWLATFRAWVARPGSPGVFLFIFLYKLGDTAMGPMVKPFWVDRGLSLEEIALISTTLGVVASVAGALVGGVLTSRWGIFRGLWTLGLLQALSNLGYAAVAWTDAGRAGVYAASLLESFTGGLGTAAFLSFLMHICDKQQAATQYAFLSALFSLSGSLAGSVSGVGAGRLGYGAYFALTFLLALPAYALFPWIRPWIRDAKSSPDGVPRAVAGG